MLQVFRKAEEANEKKEKEKDKSNYFYLKALGSENKKDLNKTPEITKATGDTDIKDVYNRLKGDLLYNPGKGDENDGVLLIKSKSDKNPNEILNKVKLSGMHIKKPLNKNELSKDKLKSGLLKEQPKKEKQKQKDHVYGVINMDSDKLNKLEDKNALRNANKLKKDDKKPLINPKNNLNEKKNQKDEIEDDLIKSNNLPDHLNEGIILPEDHKNEEYVNNLEVMADPIYTPENYIFVNEFIFQGSSFLR